MKFTEFELGQAAYGSSEAGFVIHHFLQRLDDTFNQSSVKKFTEFFNKNKDISKWMIFSDYALGDSNKPNDVITFTILPYAADFYKLAEYIDKLSFKDIKKLKRVNKEFIEFIDKSEILNISIVLPKKWALDSINERKSLETRYNLSLNQVKYWISNEGEKPYYKDLLSIYGTLLEEVMKPRPNLKAVRNIEVVSSLAAYFTYQICQVSNVDIIGWFSDRDPMLSYKLSSFKKPVIFDLVKNNFHSYMCNSKGRYREKFVFGLPEEKGRVWYDAYNRIPDLIAATIADFDLEKNECSHPKFIPIIDTIIVNMPYCMVFKIFYENDDYSSALLTFARPDDS
ncbi:TPA: hypothetical protein NKP32_004379 [Vibrio parahaemolyticus]|nr:hypothetical protein [Vibrio parahaemolyticus]